MSRDHVQVQSFVPIPSNQPGYAARRGASTATDFPAATASQVVPPSVRLFSVSLLIVAAQLSHLCGRLVRDDGNEPHQNDPFDAWVLTSMSDISKAQAAVRAGCHRRSVTCVAGVSRR